MITVLLSLVGILFGFLLAKIAPEELAPGKKYFKFMKVVFYLATLTIVTVFYILNNLYLYLIIIFVLAIILFLLQLKLKHLILDLLTYLLFFTAAYLYYDPTFNLLLATSLFLYGFPVGITLKSRKIYK